MKKSRWKKIKKEFDGEGLSSLRTPLSRGIGTKGGPRHWLSTYFYNASLFLPVTFTSLLLYFYFTYTLLILHLYFTSTLLIITRDSFCYTIAYSKKSFWLCCLTISLTFDPVHFIFFQNAFFSNIAFRNGKNSFFLRVYQRRYSGQMQTRSPWLQLLWGLGSYPYKVFHLLGNSGQKVVSGSTRWVSLPIWQNSPCTF